MTGAGDPGAVRIGDTEREHAVHALNEHFSRGRLDVAEYEQRVSQAMVARTGPELLRWFSDLPGPHPAVTAGQPGYPQQHAPPVVATPIAGQMPYPIVGTPQAVSDRSKVAAGLLQIFLPFGIGRFYTGHTGIAVAQLLVFWLGILPCGVGTAAAAIWCLVDGIVLLAGDSTDAHGRRLRS